MARTGNEKRFKELYGDFYVQGIIEGGEFYAVLEIIGFYREDEKIIANALEASYGILSLAGIDLNTEVNIDTIKKMSKKEINIYINQRGGTDEDMIFQNDIGKLIESAKNFSLALQGNSGVNYRAHLKSYKTLDQLPETNFMLLQAKKDALDDCARKRIKYRTLLNDINFYDENATLYLPESVISDEKLSLWKNHLTKLETLLRTHAIKVAGEIDFNDNFLEEIDGIPVNLSEMELPKRIEISNTQQRFEIPELESLLLDNAIAELARLKLPLAVSYVLSEVNGATSNIVKRTIPAGGEIVGAGEKLTIYYDGPKIVKEFITDTIEKNTGWLGRPSSTRLRIK